MAHWLKIAASEKYQLKSQYDITSHLSEWPSTINPQMTTVGKDVEKGITLCTVDGNADWYSHYGKEYGVLKKI